MDRRAPPRPARARWLRTLAFCLATLAMPAAQAQWPTTEWAIVEMPRVNAMAYDNRSNSESERWQAVFLDWLPLDNAPDGGRQLIARKHADMLHAASLWYASLGFPAPYQITEDGNTTVAAGERYLAWLKPPTKGDNSSAHTSGGEMKLTSVEGFLHPRTPLWELMQYSAVHELFHGIERAYPVARKNLSSQGNSLPRITQCRNDNTQDWMVEGAAAMVQIRWIEHVTGTRYRHPFKGGKKAAWVRHFDQPLHVGWLPLAKRVRNPNPDPMRKLSWACDYGSWYFWYAVGDMLGSTEEQKVAYMQFILKQDEPWGTDAINVVDKGLRAAAKAYRSIGPYDDGLYELYPQFVARYLTDDRFFQNVPHIGLEARDFLEVKADTDAPRGLLQPLSMRGWRIRVHLPRTAKGDTPIQVRFSLDTPEGSDVRREDLHLIVDKTVAKHPADPTAPYALVKEIDRTAGIAGGTVEYFVRVANIAKVAGDTREAAFKVRVEVQGFYGDTPISERPNAGLLDGIITEWPNANDRTGISKEGPLDDDLIDAASAPLPPGFSMQGPGYWNCSGGDNARAAFDLVTPDERGRDIDRALPGLARMAASQLDKLAIDMKQLREQRDDAPAELTGIDVRSIRRRVEAALAKAGPQAKAMLGDAAEAARQHTSATISATFIGRHQGAPCRIMLSVSLQDADGGAQTLIAGEHPDADNPGFRVVIMPAEFFDMMKRMRSGNMASLAELAKSKNKRENQWHSCTMTAEQREQARREAGSCPAVLCSSGTLALEAAAQNRIAGRFRFEVLRQPDEQANDNDACPVPPDRGTVTGHFNVISTDDGFDDNSMSGFGSSLLPAGFIPFPTEPEPAPELNKPAQP